MIDTTPEERCAVVIEDDQEIADLLAAILTQAGFQAHVAADGMRGLELVEAHNPVLTTLDVNLPGIDGFEVVRRIRLFSPTYVIMLSARHDEIDTLIGLNAGADDYLAKPFRPRELRARIDAMIRRRSFGNDHLPPPGEAGVPDTGWLVHNGLRLHTETRVVELDGKAVDLTRTEFDLLNALMQRRRRVLSKDELATHIRGEHDSYVLDADRRSIESHMANLRRKLADSVTEPRFIETVRGVGYRLTNPA